MRATRCSCRNCQSGLPVDASTATNRSWSSQKNTRPLAVASVPPRARQAGLRQLPCDLPGLDVDRAQDLLIRRVGRLARGAAHVRFPGDPFAHALDEHIAVLQRLHVIEARSADCTRSSTSSPRRATTGRCACLRASAPGRVSGPAVRRRRSRSPRSDCFTNGFASRIFRRCDRARRRTVAARLNQKLARPPFPVVSTSTVGCCASQSHTLCGVNWKCHFSWPVSRSSATTELAYSCRRADRRRCSRDSDCRSSSRRGCSAGS